MKKLWHLWALALGQKAHKNDAVADQVALVRTFIFATYLITNGFIMANAIRHWNDKQINVQVEIYENPNYSEKLYSKGWHDLGMDRDTRIEGVYSSEKIGNYTGEFE